jgi:hypothetical protein
MDEGFQRDVDVVKLSGRVASPEAADWKLSSEQSVAHTPLQSDARRLYADILAAASVES